MRRYCKDKNCSETGKICIPATDNPRIVVIGGGFAGLSLVRNLRNKPVQVVLFDKNNHHQFLPLLYQVATSGLAPDSIVFPFRKIFRNYKNVIFRMAEVKEIQTKRNQIITSIGDVSYDYLVIATGSSNNFFRNKSFEDNSLGLKSIVNALDIRSQLLQKLEQAALSCMDNDKQFYAHVAIAGGGPAGVEMAGALAEFRKYVLPKDYPELRSEEMKITLLEGSNRLLAAMPQKLSQKTLRYLLKMGVDVRLNTLVDNYNGKTVKINSGETFEAATFVWTAGVKANVIHGIPEKAIKKGGRIFVDEFNRIKELNNVFAIGDNAQITSPDYPNGHPMVAQPAIQQGKNLAINILRQQNGKSPIPFRYHDKGSLATIGKKRAVASIFGRSFGGVLAWLIWSAVHLMSIVGVRNRLFIGLSWLLSYFSYDKGERVIIRKNYTTT